MRNPGGCCPWRLFARLLLVLLAACSSGCVSLAPTDSDGHLSREEALSGEALFGSDAVPPLPEADILQVDPAMHAFVERFVDRNANVHLRLQQLTYAIITEGTFGLQYTDATRTAAGTFHARNGNCLSFTNMFVAMAREVGLDVAYQQVDIPPDWEQRGDTFVLNRHINVLVKLGRTSRKVVDFNIDDFKTSYDRREVSDLRAQAHYYSNVGVENLQAGSYRQAFLFLRKGLAIDDGFSPLWTNLGTLYLRSGHLDYAEASYLEALRHDSRDMVAISNLARLYARLGDTERAASMRDFARYHRERNPYYRFQQARDAFLHKEYAAALEHLDYAIGERREEDAFYFLRGLVRLQLGDTRRARIDMETAERLASDGMLKRNYHRKMEMLLLEQR